MAPVTLPSEIVEEILRHLERTEINKFKSVCKQWYQIAIRILRETICIDELAVDQEKIIDLLQVIGSSEDAAARVKYVDLYVNEQISPFWEVDEHLLKAIFETCPNIVKIFRKDGMFARAEEWHVMLYFIKNGHLKHLHTIPKYHVSDLTYYYLPMIKIMKDRVKEIFIYGGYNTEGCSYVDEIINTNNHFGEGPWITNFKALDRLFLSWEGSESLFDCDTLIEHCYMKNFKSLELYVENEFIGRNRQGPYDPEELSFVVPRPDIKEFRCMWDMLDHDTFMEYLMKKFPKLDKLMFQIEEGTHSAFYNLSDEVMDRFFIYLSNVPQLKIDFILKSDQVEKFLTLLINNTKYLIQFEVIYDSFSPYGNETVSIASPSKGYSLSKYENNVCRITLIIPYENFADGPEQPHVKWLDKFGDKIYSLNVTVMDAYQKNMYLPKIKTDDSKTLLEKENKELDNSSYNHWINHALQKCKSMKKLVITRDNELIFWELNDKEKQKNHSVQELFIQDLVIPTEEEGRIIFNTFSSCLPSLEYLFLYDKLDYSYRLHTVMFDMPDTSLKVLALGNDMHNLEAEAPDHVVVMKLYTEKSGVVTYFGASLEKILVMSEEQYTDVIQDRFNEAAEYTAPTSVSIDVRCKSLDSLRLIINRSANDCEYMITHDINL